MPFWRTYYHLVWATKNREHLITPEVEIRLFPFLSTKAGELGVYVFAVNGWYEHVHLLVAVPPAVSIAELVQKLKGASAHMLNHPQEGGYFGWQRGYGVLTLGAQQLPRAEAYVQGQKEHHRDGSTNRWLERDEPDEGESDARPTPMPAYVTLREKQCVYEAPYPCESPF